MRHALPLLISTAEAARDQQAAALARAREAVRQAEATQQRLRDFRAECLARSAAGRVGSGDASSLQVYQQFVTRLDEAIALQQGELAQRARRAGEQQLHLQRAQQKLLAFQALQRRDEGQRRAREQRREQRDADEFAARAYARALREGGA
jgi:flagellar FliJ protein